MPFGIDDALSAVSLLGGLGGLFRKPQDNRQQYITQIANQLQQQEQMARDQSRQQLYGAAGVGGDAIDALGRRLGASTAASGVYNSSATAGALEQAQRDQAAQLGNLASTNRANELSQESQNQQYLSGLRLGTAQNDLNYGRQQYQNSVGGMAGLLSKLGGMVGGGRAVPGGDAGRTRGSVLNGMQNATPTTVPALFPNQWNVPLGGGGAIPRYRPNPNPWGLGPGMQVG